MPLNFRASAVSLQALAFLFSGVTFTGVAAKAEQHASPTLRAGIAVVVDSKENPAILAAVADLRRDLEKVLRGAGEGDTATTVSEIVVTCSGESTREYREDGLRGPESYAVRSAPESDGTRIILQGSDVRGTVFAIYDFSEHALGVPPLWFWSGWQPNPRSSLDVPVMAFHTVMSPDVRWRGWFPNDTDMLVPWLEQSAGNVDLFLETLLRLRFNLLDVDHISNWNGQPNIGLVLARGCRARGIKVTFTHLAPFGLLLGDWDHYWSTVRHISSPPRTLSNLKALDEFWTYAIHFVESEQLDVIQSVEFRVDGDKPFWRMFSDAPEDQTGRARVLSAMLAHQMELLRKVDHGDPPLTRTVFYNEVGGFMDDGLLFPPKDSRLIWNYANEQRDHYPRPEIFFPHSSDQQFGYYLNLQFFTTGSHVSAGEGPWKVEQNLRMVQSGLRPGKLSLVVLNVGNLREFVTEVAVASKLLWDKAATADAALGDFCDTYFGTDREQIVGLYRAYHGAYWQQRRPDLKGFSRQYIFHDLRYARAAEALLQRIESGHYTNEPLFQDPHMLKIVPADNGAADEAHAIVKGTQAAQNALSDVKERAQLEESRLPIEKQQFFEENVVSDTAFMLAANGMLRELAEGYIHVNDSGALQIRLSAAEAHLSEMRRALAMRKRDSMSAWYERESKFDLTGLVRRLGQVRSLVVQRNRLGLGNEK